MSMQELLESGRSAYESGKHERALKQFTRAMRLCLCNRCEGVPGPRRRCECKDYEAVVESGDSLFEEIMSPCRCKVSFGKCDNPLHVAALDHRAATFEAMKELGRAEKDAKWILEIAPRLPDGYLRLGKIARLKKDYWFAWKVYGAGVEANGSTPPGSSRKLQQLHQALLPLRRQFVRKDPLSVLPLELIRGIFLDLTIAQLTTCIRVCKTWKRVLESQDNQDMWRDLIFLEGLPSPNSRASLHALVARSGYRPRRIVIKDPEGFRLHQPRLSALLTHATHLQHLELGEAYEDYYTFPRGRGLFKHLTYLKMDTYNAWERNLWKARENSEPTAEDPPDAFLRSVSATLEHLDLFGVPPVWYKDGGLPDFPRLKLLRLEHKGGLEQQLFFPIFVLAQKSPLLEQLSLIRVRMGYQPDRLWQQSWFTMWKHLVTFHYMDKHSWSLQAGETIKCITLINSLHNGKGYRHIDLDCPLDSREYEFHCLLSYEDDLLNEYGLIHADGTVISRAGQLSNLQSLRLGECYFSPARMKSILAAPVRNGCLHTFDIVFPPLDLDLPEGQATVNTLNEYNWLRGLETIRCLGFVGFDVPALVQQRDIDALPGFASSFPLLKVVYLKSSSPPDPVCAIIEAVMRLAPQIKTIYYQTEVRGMGMDRLHRLGKQLGVSVVRGERPHEWPVDLGQH